MSSAEATSPFGITMTASHSHSLVNFQDGTLKETNDFEFIPTYKWMSNQTILYVSYSQDARNSDNTDIGDILLINAFKPWNFSWFKIIPSVVGVIPESKDSRDNKNMDGGIGGKLTFAIQEKRLIPGFYFKTGVSLSRYFNRYDTAIDDGTSNTQYSSWQSLQTGYSKSIFSFDVEFDHIDGWDYNGVLHESFWHYEELTAAIGDHYGFTLGHTNSGSALRADGYSSNIRFIDENSSMVYAKLSMQY